MKKTIMFDIDGVLVDRLPRYENLGKDKYNYCYPIQHNIDLVNSLYEAGHTIHLYTSRGMSIFSGDVGRVYRELYELTFNQMKEFNISFHKLIMGKPHYDLLIDDKAINSNHPQLVTILRNLYCNETE